MELIIDKINVISDELNNQTLPWKADFAKLL